jgi:CDP-diacylglycerol--serine O-phosphatidyltransferase
MKKHIPNIITLLNLVSGACACILAIWGQYYPALLFILASACFDFLDGFSARLLHAYSDIGKELDSLADDISFGLAPSLLFFNWYYQCNHSCSALAYVPLLMAALSAYRLAKFNLDSRQATDFIGLPTPANAMIVGGFAGYGHICRLHGIDTLTLRLLDSGWFIPVVSVILALLLISEIPMFSIKKKKISFKEHPTETVFFFTVLVIMVIMLAFKPERLGFFTGVMPVTLALSFVAYILINIVSFPATKRIEENPQQK